MIDDQPSLIFAVSKLFIKRGDETPGNKSKAND
jgi:hypothetical protein